MAPWVKKQETLLLADKGEAGIAQLERFVDLAPALATTIHYFQQNADRMRYGTYRQRGYFIGSGAIESAHRTVVQKRMKLSGQPWSKKGAQHMLNLRVLYMNRQWDKVIQLAKSSFANAA